MNSEGKGKRLPPSFEGKDAATIAAKLTAHRVDRLMREAETRITGAQRSQTILNLLDDVRRTGLSYR